MKLIKEKSPNGGFYISAIVGKKEYKSYWSSPPDCIDHVGKHYLKDRYSIITTQKRVETFKRLYKDLWNDYEELA